MAWKFQNSAAQGARANLCDLPRVPRSADRLPIHVDVPRSAAAPHGLPAAHGRWRPRDAGGACGSASAAECHGAATTHRACDTAADAAKAMGGEIWWDLKNMSF